jgi:spore germination protein GerM
MTLNGPRLMRLGFVVGAVSAVLLVAACGVPSSDGAEALPDDIRVIGPIQTAPTPAESGMTVTVAWVDTQDRLQLVPRPEIAQSTQEKLSDAMQALIAGPTVTELDAGLSTTISVDAELQAELRGRRARIDIVEAGSSRPDPLLPVAQVAVTALSIPGVLTAVFISDGERTPVPIPSDSSVERPLTLRDFESLLS